MAQQTITYEQPMNEHIRMCLRLEHLLLTVEHHLHLHSPTDSEQTLFSLLRILTVIDRPDLKSKLTKTLRQQTATLTQLKRAPQVDLEKLEVFLKLLDKLIYHFESTKEKIADNLFKNSFLKQVRSLLYNPCGPCSFNCPAYALWLKQSPDDRIIDLENWSNSITYLNKAIRTILRITRDSSIPQEVTASAGLFQQSLDNPDCQLIRITLPTKLKAYPEISAGKHRLVIRFLALNTQETKRLEQDIPFLLNCCRL